MTVLAPSYSRSVLYGQAVVSGLCLLSRCFVKSFAEERRKRAASPKHVTLFYMLARTVVAVMKVIQKSAKSMINE